MVQTAIKSIAKETYSLYYQFSSTFRSVSETDMCSGSQPHEFTKEPPNMDTKNIIRPVVEKLDQLRQIRTIYKRADVSSSEEEKDTSADLEQQRSSSISFGKHVDFIRCKYDTRYFFIIPLI